MEDQLKKSPSRNHHKWGLLGDSSFAYVDSQHCEGFDQPQSFLKARNDPQIILKITSNEKYRHNDLLADQKQQLKILVEDRSEILERPDLSGRCIIISERSVFPVPLRTWLSIYIINCIYVLQMQV